MNDTGNKNRAVESECGPFHLSQLRGAQSIVFTKAPYLLSAASVAGSKEAQGPLGKCFDLTNEDDLFGAETWEEAESNMQKEACVLALGKSHVDPKSVRLLTVDVNKICTIEHKPEQGRLLYVGSMIERKGLDLLVSALRYVDENFQLRIVGNGTDKEIEELRTRIKNANIEDNIIFCGYKEGQELLEEYQKAQIFVLPTREDCFGLVLLEALCAEVPIISSKYADGAYDVIDEGKNGILVDPYDSKEFGDTINKVLKKEISLDGKKDIIVDKFTFDEVSKGYINAIDYVLKGER